MKKVKLYFNRVIDLRSLSSLLNSELGRGEYSIEGIFSDKNGILFASVFIDSEIPNSYIQTLSHKNLKVTSVLDD